jgi:hypothetical protein
MRGMEPRDIALAQARGRMAFGVAFLIAPGLAARGWVGGDAMRPGAKVLTRALGARDLALGLGIVIALDRGAPARGWLEASALADSVDFLATLIAGSALPPAGRRGVLALASGSAALAGWLAGRIDSQGEPLEGMTPEAVVTGHPPEQPG